MKIADTRLDTMETGASMVRGVGTVVFLYLTLVPTDEKKMCYHVHNAYISSFHLSVVL